MCKRDELEHIVKYCKSTPFCDKCKYHELCESVIDEFIDLQTRLNKSGDIIALAPYEFTEETINFIIDNEIKYFSLK